MRSAALQMSFRLVEFTCTRNEGSGNIQTWMMDLPTLKPCNQKDPKEDEQASSSFSSENMFLKFWCRLTHLGMPSTGRQDDPAVGTP